MVLCVILEQREGCFDVTLLESSLTVEAQVPSVFEESAAGRVGIDACQVNFAFLSKVTYESCILIGMTFVTSGMSLASSWQ